MKRRLVLAVGVLMAGCGHGRPSVTVAAIAPSPVDVFDRAERHPSRGIPRELVPTSTTSTTRAADLGTFETTCYGPPDFPAGQHTSSGQPVGPGSIAADPAVIPRGTRLHVDGWGDGIVNDTGGAIHGRRLDLWGPSHGFCVRWGRRRVSVRRAG